MADVTKIKLPNNNVVNIKDYRIPGVDQAPTSGSVNLVTSGGVYQDIEDASLVTSAALNDLNDRLVDIEEDWVTTEEYSQIESAVRDTYTKQEIDTMLSDIESGGIDNVVTQVNVGATPYNPSNGIVSLPAYPTSLPASDVSSWAKSSTKPTYTATEVGAQEVLVSGTNIKTINNQSLLGSGNLIVGENMSIHTIEADGWSSAYFGYVTITNATYQSFLDDINNGKSIVIRTTYNDNGHVYSYDWMLLEYSSNNLLIFVRSGYSSGSYPAFHEIFVYPPATPGGNAGVSSGEHMPEMPGNKINSITGSGTTHNYPSTKAVVDYVAANVMPAVSTWGQFLVSDWDSTSSSYKWRVSPDLYFNSATALQIDGSGGVLSPLFNTKSGPQGQGSWIKIDSGGLIGEAYRNQSVYSDWSWIKYRSSYSPSAYVTLQDTLDAKQNVLVSGTNIKTINNQSLLGSGNITISGGGDTSSCVHKTGDETVGGDKTFTDDVIVGDASNIKYGASSGEGFTRGYATNDQGDASQTFQFTGLAGEPKAFVISYGVAGDIDSSGVDFVIGDSTGCHGVYNTGSQHNYSASFTKSYSNGTLTITAPTGVVFGDYAYSIVYYYGDGTLTFKTSQVTPGSGVTSVTFTGTGLTETPAMYVCMLETQINDEQYRRVAGYSNCAIDNVDIAPMGFTFLTGGHTVTTSSFSVSYNNGLVINSGGTNAGGYFHNPGTYTLYYLMASDIGGGSSYNSLKDELDGIRNTISGIETLLAAI